MTLFMKGKMKNTFSKHFPHKHAKWDSDQIIFDQNHSCKVDIKTELNMMRIESYTGDKEFIIKQLVSWFQTHTIPYLISCEKKTYTPFPGTEYMIRYLIELQKLFDDEYYREEMLLRFDLELEMIHIYYKQVDDSHKFVSLSKQNFQSWKEEAQREKENMRVFQERLQHYVEKHKTEKTKNPVVFKFWNQKEEDWRYRVIMKKGFTIEKLSEKNFQKIIQFHNSFVASEQVLIHLLQEIKKWDPYVCTRNKNEMSEQYDIFAFGKEFSYKVEKNNYEKNITFVVEDTTYTITKPSYLLENGIEKRMCVQELLKPFKERRLSRIMQDKKEKHPVILPLRLYLGQYYNSKFIVVNEANIENEAFQEIWEHIQENSLKKGMEIQTIKERTFCTKHYDVYVMNHLDWLSITKKENKSK